MNKKNNTLWVERYRPKILDEYIGNKSLVERAKIWIESGDIPHLLLYGVQGTGKTSLAKLLVKNIDCDYIYINASDERGIDIIRNKIKNFSSSVGFKNLKVVILDEGDYLTHDAQPSLRNLMETFSSHTRFIITCNYVEKIIPPLRSRCHVYNITPPSRKEIAVRLYEILKKENIKFSMEDIKVIINNSYPDIRKAINSCQKNCVNGEIKVDNQSIIESNYMLKILDQLKSNNTEKECFDNIRKIIASTGLKQFQGIYDFLYANLDDYASGHIGNVILLIAEAQYKDIFVVDKEINTMSMFVEIIRELKR